jgi:cell division protein FtsB
VSTGRSRQRAASGRGSARGGPSSRARRSAQRGRRAGAGRSADRRALRHLLQGDRLYLLALVVVVTVVGTMALGPLQRYTAAADRVDALEETRDQLRSEVDGLEERQRRLQDPDELELLARSELGLVKPGEIPFVVVAPDDDLAPVSPHVDAATGDGDPDPWYRRFGRALSNLFTADA